MTERYAFKPQLTMANTWCSSLVWWVGWLVSILGEDRKMIHPNTWVSNLKKLVFVPNNFQRWPPRELCLTNHLAHQVRRKQHEMADGSYPRSQILSMGIFATYHFNSKQPTLHWMQTLIIILNVLKFSVRLYQNVMWTYEHIKHDFFQCVI